MLDALRELVSAAADAQVEDLRLRLPKAVWRSRTFQESAAAVLDSLLVDAPRIQHVAIMPRGCIAGTCGAMRLAARLQCRRDAVVTTVLLGTHARAGAESPLRLLDEGALAMIISAAVGCIGTNTNV